MVPRLQLLIRSFDRGPLAQRLEQGTFTGRRRGNLPVVRCKFGERFNLPTPIQAPARVGEGVEAIITRLNSARRSTVKAWSRPQTRRKCAEAAKAEVVSIIPWSSVRIRQGPPVSAPNAKRWRVPRISVERQTFASTVSKTPVTHQPVRYRVTASRNHATAYGVT